MSGGDKRLNEMNRLGDMGHFPAVVNAGATLNVLMTICVTWKFIEPRFTPWLAIWVAVVLAINLLPVLILRLAMGSATEFRTVSTMNFFSDQHKFSDWVYVAASANMTFWVMLAWTAAEFDHRLPVLLGVLAIAAIATFSPVLLRSFRKDG